MVGDVTDHDYAAGEIPNSPTTPCSRLSRVQSRVPGNSGSDPMR